MLDTIRDDTWDVLNMQHIKPNLKRWDYSDIPGGGHNRFKGPPPWLKVDTILEKPPTPTHKVSISERRWKKMLHICLFKNETQYVNIQEPLKTYS